MKRTPEYVLRARADWHYTGTSRPPFAEVPRTGQESVWDYPRPPEVRPDGRLVEISVGGELLASTRRSLRVLETASPPTFYIPPADVEQTLLRASPQAATSFCEWKGEACYFDVLVGGKTYAASLWSYLDPLPEYASLAGLFSAYPARLDCAVDGVAVEPQPGGFYGGWVTPELVGPFKGDPGSGAW